MVTVRSASASTSASSWVTSSSPQPSSRRSASSSTSSAQVRRVLAEGRLVGDDHPRRGGDRGRHREPALLAAGERVRVGRRRAGVRPSRSSSSSARAPAAASVRPGPPRPDVQLVAHRRGDELVLRVLEDRADPADQVAAAPAPQRPRRLRRVQRGLGPHLAAGRPQQPGHRQRQRRLAGAVRPGQRHRRAGAQRRGRSAPARPGRRPGSGTARAWPRTSVRARRRRSLPGVRRDAGRAPTRPRRPVRRPARPKTSAGEPSATTPPPGSSTTARSTRSTTCSTRCSTITAVAPGGRQHAGEHVADQRDAGRVEVRGHLVEQQQPGAQREDAGQRQPLLLAAGQRAGGGVPAVGEADRGQRLVDPRPDLVGATPRFSRPNATSSPARPITSAASGSCSTSPARARASRAGRPSRSTAPSCSPASDGVEQPGQRGEQGALAGAGRPEQQHPLAGLDAQVDPAQRPGLPAAVPPAPAADVDRDRRDGECGQTRAWSAPDGNGDSTPVRASARTSSHEPTPATTAALTTTSTRVGQLPGPGPVRVVEDQVQQGGRGAGQRAGEDRRGQPPGAVQRQGEDELRRGALDQAVRHDVQAPRRCRAAPTRPRPPARRRRRRRACG